MNLEIPRELSQCSNQHAVGPGPVLAGSRPGMVLHTMRPAPPPQPFVEGANMSAPTDPTYRPTFADRKDLLADVIRRIPGYGEETARNVARGLVNLKKEDARVLAALLNGDALEVGEAWEAEVEDDVVPLFVSLATLETNPELLAPPSFVVPRFGVKGRASLLAGREKSGKSTLLAQLAADKSLGRRCMGEEVLPGLVLWLGLEEALNDAVRRFRDLEADPEKILLATYTPKDPLGEVRAIMDSHPVALLIVDSLYALAMAMLGKVPDSGDAATWGSVTRPLVNLSRKYGVGSITSHHAVKSEGGGYRDSTEIGASFDALYTLKLPTEKEPQNLRHVTMQGRWRYDPFDVEFSEGRYTMATGGTLSLDALLLIHIEQNPGISGTRLREMTHAKQNDVVNTLQALKSRGAIVPVGSGPTSGYAIPSPQHDLEGI